MGAGCAVISSTSVLTLSVAPRLSAFGFRLSPFAFRLSAFGFRLSAFSTRLDPTAGRTEPSPRFMSVVTRIEVGEQEVYGSASLFTLGASVSAFGRSRHKRAGNTRRKLAALPKRGRRRISQPDPSWGGFLGGKTAERTPYWSASSTSAAISSSRYRESHQDSCSCLARRK